MAKLYRLPLLLTLTDDPNVGNLRLLRKKLLAELELAGGQTLRIGKHHYTKDDLIKMFDAAADDDGQMEYAQLIMRLPWLRRLMTEAHLVHPAAVRADDPLLQSEGFARFAMPYLEEAYWRCWKRSFESLHDAEAYAWARVAPAPVFVHARQRAMLRVRDYLEADLLASSQRSSQEKLLGEGGYHTKNLVTYCPKIVRILCELPDSFQDIKAGYARAWTDIIVYQATTYGNTVFLDALDYLHDLLPTLSHLHAELKQKKKAAFKKIAPFRAAQRGTPIHGGEQEFNYKSLWWIIWLLFIVLRTCS